VEIRLLDAQECPRQDLVVVAFVTTLVRALSEEKFMSLPELQAYDENDLAGILGDAIVHGERADARRQNYAQAWGSRAHTLQELLQDLSERFPPQPAFLPGLKLILEEGPLARRLVRRHEKGESLREIYGNLAECMRTGEPYRSR
jgi:hypothetical protein